MHATDREKVSTFSANLCWALTLGMGYLASWLIASKLLQQKKKRRCRFNWHHVRVRADLSSVPPIKLMADLDIHLALFSIW